MFIFYNALTGEKPYVISEHWVTWTLSPTSCVWLVPGTLEETHVVVESVSHD